MFFGESSVLDEVMRESQGKERSVSDKRMIVVPTLRRYSKAPVKQWYCEKKE